MRIRKVDYVDDQAEGDCCGIPYNTGLANHRGVHIHFWLDQSDDTSKLSEAIAAAQAHRDVVSASWSHGMPRGYWARSDIK